MQTDKNFKSIIVSFLILLVSGCAQGLNKTQTGALSGTAAGAGLGAIIGNQMGNTGAGIAIGAATGALGGAVLGNEFDHQDERNNRIRAELDQSRQETEELKRLVARLEKKGADVRTTGRGVVVNLPDVLFEFDSARLTSDARGVIRDIARVLTSVKGRRIAVEGHTDSTGSSDYNKKLSSRRASSVAGALSRYGVPRRQMRTQGFGEDYPIATNSTRAGRQRNRRVEVIVERHRARRN